MIAKTVAFWTCFGVLAAGVALLGGDGDDLAPMVLSETAERPGAGDRAGSGATDPARDAAAAPDSSLSGTWSAAQGSEAGYSIEEDQRMGGTITVQGRTTAVTGSLTIEGTTITAAEVTVDMTSLTSPDPLRDLVLSTRYLETDTFRETSFVLSEPVEIAEVPAFFTPLELEVSGELSLHGVTLPRRITLSAQLLDADTIEVLGRIEVALADHGIERPDLLGLRTAREQGTIELLVRFAR